MNEENFITWLDTFSSTFKQLSDLRKKHTIDHLFDSFEAPELYYVSTNWEKHLKRDFIRLLPVDIAEHILQFLDVSSLLICCSVSKVWNDVVSNSVFLWRNVCLDFGWKVVYPRQTGPELKLASKKAKLFFDKLADGSMLKSSFLRAHGHKTSVLRYGAGNRLAAGSKEGGVILWDIETSELVYNVSTHSVSDILFNAKHLYTASFDCTIACWKWATGAKLKEFRGHTAAVFTISLNYEKDFLLSGSADNAVILWRLSNCQLIKIMQGHTEWVEKSILKIRHEPSVCYKKGEAVAITRDKLCIKLWRSEGSSVECIRTLSPYDENKLNGNLALEGDNLICSSFIMVSVWKFTTLELIRVLSLESTMQVCVGMGSMFFVGLLGNDFLLNKLEFASSKKRFKNTSYMIPSKMKIKRSYRVGIFPPSNHTRMHDYLAFGSSVKLDGFTDFDPKGLFVAVILYDHSIFCLRFKDKRP